MYHDQIKNQHSKTKNIASLVCDVLNTTICKEIEHPGELRGHGNKILEYLFVFKNNPGKEISNDRIASQVGCDVRTVRRWTNTFVRMGIIAKKRDDIFTLNRYFISPRVSKKFQFQMWSRSCTKEQYEKARPKIIAGLIAYHERNSIQNNLSQKVSISFRPETVLPLNNSYIYNNSVKPITRERAREAHAVIHTERSTDHRQIDKIQAEKKQRLRVVQGIIMLKQEFKKWVMEHTSDADARLKAREALWDNAPVRSLLITPEREKLASLLSLDERETLKLIAFPDEAIASVLAQVTTLLSKPWTGRPVLDRMGWLISLLMSYCKLHSLQAEWKWYFTLCDITGIEKVKMDEPPKPLIVQGTPPHPPRGEFSWDRLDNIVDDQPRYTIPSSSQAKDSRYAKNPMAYDDVRRRESRREAHHRWWHEKVDTSRKVEECLTQKECQEAHTQHSMKLLGLPSPGNGHKEMDTGSLMDKLNKRLL